jgi:L-alanine-DL-glutamate epimerase-like enolase superfamily enzyme
MVGKTLEQAIHVVEALREYDIWWIEEPFPPDEMTNHSIELDLEAVSHHAIAGTAGQR